MSQSQQTDNISSRPGAGGSKWPTGTCPLHKLAYHSVHDVYLTKACILQRILSKYPSAVRHALLTLKTILWVKICSVPISTHSCTIQFTSVIFATQDYTTIWGTNFIDFKKLLTFACNVVFFLYLCVTVIINTS